MSRLSIEEFRRKYNYTHDGYDRLMFMVLNHLSTDEPLYTAAKRLHDAEHEFATIQYESGIEMKWNKPT